MRRALLTGTLVAAAILCMSRDAHAQYKNLSWGIYAGAGFWTPGNNVNYFPEQQQANAGLIPADGTPTVKGTPYSMINPMLHFEFNFKISDNFTWWFKSGVSIGLLQIARAQSLVTNPEGTGGAALLLELNAGPRVYFLTDEFRPYFELGVRIPIPGVLVFSNSNDAIPQNLKSFPGLYGNLGFEIFIARDIAFSIVGGYTRMFLINFAGINVVDAKLGVLFYM